LPGLRYADHRDASGNPPRSRSSSGTAFRSDSTAAHRSSRTGPSFHAGYGVAAPDGCPAAFRRQSGHRQSFPSDGIGRRNFSSAHQHDPERPQENSVPQRAQARRREGRLSVRFVIKPVLS